MNIVSMNVCEIEKANCIASTEDYDVKAAVLWLWDAEDLREILLLHPNLITFGNSAHEGSERNLWRVSAVGGQPIKGVRDLLLCTAPRGFHAGPGSTEMSLLITNTLQGRQEVEDGGFGRPCLKLDLYEPVQGPAVPQAYERCPSSAIAYAYVVGNRSAAVGPVVKAFAAAFGCTAVAELLIYTDEPASVRSLVEEYGPQELHDHVHVEHCSRLAGLSGRDAWPFDVLIKDDAPDRVQPIALEAALRDKQIVPITLDRQSHAASAADGEGSSGLAAEMLLAARRLGQVESGAARDTTKFARTLAPARLARRLRWITQAPIGEFQADGLSGVGWVTRWNVKCGIGDHAAQQIESCRDRHVVLAPRELPSLAADESNVFRCWSLGLEANGLEEAAAVVFRERLACVVIHFNWGFFKHSELGWFISAVRSGGRAVILEMHSTTSHQPEPGLRLADFADCFNGCDRVLVHQPADADRVRLVAPNARLAIEPLGIALRDSPSTETLRGGPRQIACFGFCLPNKGIEELVFATWMLRQSGEDVRLLLLNAEHPAPQSRQTIDEVRQLISRLDLSDAVTFVTDYLEEAKCMDMLSQASLIVNPYQHTGESASAAVRFALASTVPVLVTPLPIFDDLGGAVFRAEGTSPAELAKAIRSTLAEIKMNSRAAANVEDAASKWREVHDLRVQTRRILGISESIRRNRRAEDWLKVGAC